MARDSARTPFISGAALHCAEFTGAMAASRLGKIPVRRHCGCQSGSFLRNCRSRRKVIAPGRGM